MRVALKPHPDTPCEALSSIEVEVDRLGDQLALTYVLGGDLAALALPQEGEPARVDDLWKHTCFEAFVRPGTGSRYFELNAAPSQQWAAYGFETCREGMTHADEVCLMLFRREEESGQLAFTVIFEELPGSERWRVGVSAVIETIDGHKSYWALAHPPGKPDFHHPDAFVLDL